MFIVREELMLASKINSTSTYHKCILVLSARGYIKYIPSRNPLLSSQVIMIDFTNYSNKSAPVSSIINQVNDQPIPQVDTLENSPQATPHNEPPKVNITKQEPYKKGVKGAQKARAQGPDVGSDLFNPPEEFHVAQFFVEQKSSPLEATQFINYYTSNGWLVGGKTPMKDWKASALSWISKIAYFAKKSTKSTYLHSVTNKDYDQPL